MSAIRAASLLGVVSLCVLSSWASGNPPGPRACSLSCSALVPTTGAPGFPLTATASVTPTSCGGGLTYEWSLGDGSPLAYGSAVVHTYTVPGVFPWTLTARADGATCSASGSVSIQVGGEAWRTTALLGGHDVGAISGRALRLDGQGHLHVLYGGDRLYHAWNEGAGWRVEVVDPDLGSGAESALAVDTTAGTLHALYRTGRLRSVRYARKAAGGPWTFEDLEFGDDYVTAGEAPALALDSQRRPHLAWSDSEYFGSVLRYAWNDGTKWAFESAASTDGPIPSISLAIDSSDVSHVAYHDSYLFQQRLRYARRTAGVWSASPVEVVGGGGIGCSLALDSQGRPHVVYESDWSAPTGIRWARWNGTAWVISSSLTPEAGGAGTPSLALDVSDNPVVAYVTKAYPGSLRLARFDGAAWLRETADAEGKAFPSLFREASGTARVSYLTAAGTLRLATRGASGWTLEAIDAQTGPGPLWTAAYDSIRLRKDPAGALRLLCADRTASSLRLGRLQAGVWSFETIGSAALGGDPWVAALAFDAQGRPAVAYGVDASGWNVRLARFDGSAWSSQQVDSGLNGIGSMALEFDAAGRPHLAYTNTAQVVRYAVFDGTWSVETLDQGATQPRSNLDMAVTPDGTPHVAWIQNVGPAVVHAERSGGTWTKTTVTNEPTDAVAVALDGAGSPLVAWARPRPGGGFPPYPGTVRFARFSGGAFAAETVEDTATTPYTLDLVLDASDRPHLAYLEASAWGVDPRHAWHDGSSWHAEAAPTGGHAASGSGFGLDVDVGARPRLAFYDGAARDLVLVERLPALVYGDLDLSGTVDVFDVVTLMGHVVGNVQPGSAPFLGTRAAADLDRNGVVDVFDVVLLMSYVVGNVPALPL